MYDSRRRDTRDHSREGQRQRSYDRYGEQRSQDRSREFLRDPDRGDKQEDVTGEHGNVLYVANMPLTVDNAELETMFETFGKIKKAHVVYEGVRSDGTRPSRGFGFVTMSTHAHAKDALEFWSSRNYQGRELNVQFSKSKQPRGGAGASGLDVGSIAQNKLMNTSKNEKETDAYGNITLKNGVVQGPGAAMLQNAHNPNSASEAALLMVSHEHPFCLFFYRKFLRLNRY